MKIDKIILSLIDEYKNEIHSINKPSDINSGLCDVFAVDVIDRMGGYSDNLFEMCTEHLDKSDHLPGHVWIRYKGRHYDSEHPMGVNEPKELNIFKYCQRYFY